MQTDPATPRPRPQPAGPTQRTEPPPAAPAAPLRRSFVQRLLAVLKLDSSVYEEVERDPDALTQAAAVVGLAAIATALGGLGLFGVRGLLVGILLSAVSWALWTTLVWAIGVKLFSHTSNFEELLRTLGFVATPQILWILGVIPWTVLHGLIALVVAALTLISFFLAVRAALDVGNSRALLVSVLAVAAYLLLGAVLGGLT